MSWFNVLENDKKFVLNDTWGHLKPEPNVKYYGWILVTVTAYDDTVIIDHKFEGLPNSPWQYRDFDDYLYGYFLDADVGVYLFKGWYKRFKNGNYQFQANKWKKIKIDVLEERSTKNEI